MKLLQFFDPIDGQHVGVIENDVVVDLTSVNSSISTVYDLYYNAGGDSNGLVDATKKIKGEHRNFRQLSLTELLENRDPSRIHLTKPISGPDSNPHALKVWLAGVTHEVSAKLREIEAKQATGSDVNVYDQKYKEVSSGGRPELFSKGESDTVVGHGQAITRPSDTVRLVPETELVSIYGVNSAGQIDRLGFTGGNDVTDNGIEADNPLNLPQAKNWAGGCASLGPLLVTTDEYDDADVTVSCEILRNGKRVGFKQGETGQNNLNMPDSLLHLERYLFRRIMLEPRTLLSFFWGTPIVFSEVDMSDGLQVGDVMKLEFSGGIGTLENEVVALPKTKQLEQLESKNCDRFD
ncbi:MAG: fumarylacetoacetate hydrolase family protein [Candidatus Latescibacterota bacterium]|nr:fumarylacetoacetate hydrolase family protein [Candidatus Latescibacterota bacterium]